MASYHPPERVSAGNKDFEVKADAETWARSIENKMDRGVFVSMAEAESTTLGEALDRYAQEVTPHKKGASRELDRISLLKRHPLATRYLANIRWDWVDLKRPAISLPDRKNGEPMPIPLTSTAVKILRDLPRRLDGGVLGINTDQITRGFLRACRRAKSVDGKKAEPIEDLRFHDLRHEAISRFFEKGLSAEQVMRITGHKTYSMLARYTHTRMDEDMMAKLG